MKNEYSLHQPRKEFVYNIRWGKNASLWASEATELRRIFSPASYWRIIAGSYDYLPMHEQGLSVAGAVKMTLELAQGDWPSRSASCDNQAFAGKVRFGPARNAFDEQQSMDEIVTRASMGESSGASDHSEIC